MLSSSPIKIPTGRRNGSISFHESPTAGFSSGSPVLNYLRQSTLETTKSRALKPFQLDEIRLLLLENISQDAVDAFKASGFKVDHFTKAWTEEELCEKIGQYQAIGIRSKTHITANVLKHAKNLLAIGCFCIGTNQVDLKAAATCGVPVFNSPFSNSRSVAELVMSEVIALARQLVDRANEMRQGAWNKVSKNCFEIRGKTLGIVGYGHIGSQLSVLAEAFGMDVLYYDVLNLMPLGNASQVASLAELLSESDFVTIHVPELPETTNMISVKELAQMKKGAYLINNARGKVIDIPALVTSMKSKHVAGCAIDVFPSEPGSNGADAFNNQLNHWATELRALPNVILTPHIGGSTEEAQRMIGYEVSGALTRHIMFGGTLGSVNYPEVDLRHIQAHETGYIRVCYTHRNEPGVLKAVNEILGNFNVEKQFSDSKGDTAYLLADISGVSDRDTLDLYSRLQKTSANISTRLLT